MSLTRHRLSLAAATAALAVAATGATALATGGHARTHSRAPHARRLDTGTGATTTLAAHQPATTTPIKHLVVIFQENVSFDHYFGTYPHAANPGGEPYFQAAPGTPSVNGLTTSLLTRNPNGANPQRLDRSTPLTCDQDHNYTPEQQAFDHGLMDKFIPYTDTESCSAPDQTKPNLVMDYYDGNTVTGMWNYAQHFAMSDNSYGTTFGPSTPGALNLVSGQTHGATPAALPGVTANGTDIGDADPTYDDCSAGSTIAMNGPNIGDLLNKQGVSWGWFEGGFTPTSATAGKAVCGSAHTNVGGASVSDYSAHHEPFQYYASTANPHHLPPTSTAMIGHTDQAKHQYDLSSFWAAVDNGTMPSVSFLKASRYQDGHAGYSDPLDEQHFIVDTINRLERTRDWRSTAVVIAYDDSDGWYDHQIGPIVNQSSDPANDALSAPGQCGTATSPLGGYQDRCGYGPRLPLLVISPYARVNSVDHTVTDQSSVLRFIEDNWSTGQIGDGSFDSQAGTLSNMFDFGGWDRAPRLFLDPVTGQPTSLDRGPESRGRGWAG
ncbi:MAG: alkaline phosphatase family protein [Solirubrobacteraceae bacterium]